MCISGLGGVGKTQLALEYAHDHHPEPYRVVLWVDAAKTETLQADYHAIAELLRLPERNSREIEQCVRAVKEWLAEHTHWLLILDNVDDLELARSFLPSQLGGHVVFTARSQIVDKIARKLELEVMMPEEGELFLLRRADKLSDKDNPDVRQTVRELVELLGKLPLALDQTGAYVAGTGRTFAEYIEIYDKERRRLLERRGLLGGEHPDSVAVTFELCFTKACELHSIAGDILHFCAFLYPDAIPAELFQHDEGFKRDTIAFDDGIEALQCYSLFSPNTQQKTFSMHRLVQAVLIDDMPPDLQHAVERACGTSGEYNLSKRSRIQELEGVRAFAVARIGLCNMVG